MSSFRCGRRGSVRAACPPRSRSRSLSPPALLLSSPAIGGGGNESRSSSRSAHMRRIREERLSAVERYTSMSWREEAKVSNVGAREVVMRERREDTSAGDICARDGGCWAVLRSDSIRGVAYPRRVRSDCCVGSNIDESTAESEGGSRLRCSPDGAVLYAGIDGARNSAVKACRSACNLRQCISNHPLQRTLLLPYRLICSSNSLIFSAFWMFFGFGCLTTTAGGAWSSRENQLYSSGLLEKSCSSSS